MSVKSVLLMASLLTAGLIASCGQASETAAGDAAQNVAMGGAMGAQAMGAAMGQQAMGQAMGAQAMGAQAMGAGMGGGMAAPAEPTSDLVPSAIAVYKSAGGQDLKLHIFNPEGHTVSSNAPALIFFHGGGFRRGTPLQGYDLSELFNAHGVVIVSAQYRFVETADNNSLEQLISDSKSAVRYMRANADSLGVDPGRIVTTGHSAGAYLALSAGMFDGFNEAGEDTSVSAQSNGMVVWSGRPERTAESTAEIVGDLKLEDYKASTYLRANLPPSLFIHGTEDTNIPIGPTKDFMESLVASGNKSSFYTIEGADHFFRQPGQLDEVYNAILGFMVAEGFTDK